MEKKGLRLLYCMKDSSVLTTTPDSPKVASETTLPNHLVFPRLRTDLPDGLGHPHQQPKVTASSAAARNLPGPTLTAIALSSPSPEGSKSTGRI